MSSSDLAISVRGVGKRYTIRHRAADAPTTLAEAITRRLRRPFARAGGSREEFWALKDVTFDVKRGEVVGIIGRNGAGKSTLLKILSRITEMTTGEVDLFGRVGSLLEVGTGFHQELTGRENIFLNGAILGMTRGEIRRQFDAIVDFAGVEKFLDTPVKRYSSGMYVRLAFAVAAHLRSEILIVDEVLAVGDAEFQKKCLGKMKQVSTDGRTVLFVSHNMAAVAALCSSALVLGGGKVLARGDSATCTQQYLESPTVSSLAPRARPGRGNYRFEQVRPEAETFRPDQPKAIGFWINHIHGVVGPMSVEMYVTDPNGIVVSQCDSRLIGKFIQDEGKLIRGRVVLSTPWLKPNRYRVRMVLAANSWIDVFDDACAFSVSSTLPYPSTGPDSSTEMSPVLSEFDLQLTSDSKLPPAVTPVESTHVGQCSDFSS